MLQPKNLLVGLVLLLATSDLALSLPNPGPANTTSAESNADLLPLEKRSCPSRRRAVNWIAGCSDNWAGRCWNACVQSAPGKNCCEGLASGIRDSCGFISPLAKNCYCSCWAYP
ncbi:hypothetical protein QBC34DRAFT_499041 [Podospora aff. communis PSN243]|uniref:Uncharacterized protein n=1 Tax=Podospora aff. communis PSN243 TaxID=3040156 RepID=A0AAV9G755_9PEZI|nr:hypothetical protein QBC34DRAFT_499041 [Podospora aff. communis PSN243]